MNRRKLVTVVGYPIKKYGTCMFAVTNRCNARCGFCSIPSQRSGSALGLEQAKLAIERLYAIGVRYIQFTGGEPMLYPALAQLITHASDLGILATVVTNGSLLNPKRAQALASAGVQGVSISVDHHDSAILEDNRGIPGLAARITQGARYIRDLRIPLQASTTISRLLDLRSGDYLKLIEQNRQAGFDGTYFCYPLQATRSNYSLGGPLAIFEKAELAAIIAHIQMLKRQGYPIDNSYETLDIVLDFLEGRPSRYPCVAGYKVFYLDWELNLYDCMTKGNLIGSVLELDPEHLNLSRVECEECVLSCDREPSIYHHGIRSVMPFLRLVGQTAARQVPL